MKEVRSERVISSVVNTVNFAGQSVVFFSDFFEDIVTGEEASFASESVGYIKTK